MTVVECFERIGPRRRSASPCWTLRGFLASSRKRYFVLSRALIKATASRPRRVCCVLWPRNWRIAGRPALSRANFFGRTRRGIRRNRTADAVVLSTWKEQKNSNDLAAKGSVRPPELQNSCGQLSVSLRRAQTQNFDKPYQRTTAFAGVRHGPLGVAAHPHKYVCK